MKTIGYCGGGLLFRLGNEEEVESFFDCIRILQTSNDNFDQIVDRLYRKYIKFEDLDLARDAMRSIALLFKEANFEDVVSKISVPSTTKLNFDRNNLFDIYSKFFSGFEDVIESSKYFYEDYGKYQPISIVVVDIPAYDKYKRLPVSVFEKVQRSPIWLREAKGEELPEFDELLPRQQ
tara:strand:+ start:353 stop:886 length:534 start_codon:yes stop_codon:yes gene_type:complete